MNTSNNNPYAPPSAKVGDVVDNTSQELAGRGVRLGAALLDGLIAGLFVYVPLLIGLGSSLATIATNPEAILPLLLGAAGLAALVGLIIWGTITFILVKRNSQTIAKKILGIKVVRSDGSPITLARIFFLRNVVNALIGFIPFVGGIYSLVDHLFIFADSRQCLHDKIADSIVIKA
jgi:uncharacterized RDD family membrane protein YckC